MKPDLQELVARWQETLRLRDWRLNVQYVRGLAAPDGTPCHGICHPHVDAKRAVISIRDPETPVSAADPDVEQTLIHELLHLHFAPLADNSNAGITAEEQAVWAITEAFASVTDAAVRARLARAVVSSARKRTPRTRKERKQGMDPVIVAALRAALTAEDPKAAIEALLSQLEGASGEAPAPAEQAAEGEPPRNAAADDEPEPRASAASPAAAGARTAAVRTPAPAATRRAVVPASGLVSRREFDRFRVERMLDARSDLTEAQRAFGIELPYETAAHWLKTIPAAGAGAASPAADAGQRTARASVPTHGARRATTSDEVLTQIDRRMGIAPPPEQSVSRDPRTGRLQISSLQPVRLKRTEG